jgi:hypothetical protein
MRYVFLVYYIIIIIIIIVGDLTVGSRERGYRECVGTDTRATAEPHGEHTYTHGRLLHTGRLCGKSKTSSDYFAFRVILAAT